MLPKLVDFNHAFYRPLWIRLLIVGGLAAWTAIEFTVGSTGWGLLVGAIFAYSLYGLFIAFAPPPDA